MLKIIRGLILLLNSIIVLALLIIHFVVKDTGFYESLLFYIFPLPIMIVIILILSLFLGKKKRKYQVIIAGILMLIWLGRSFKIHSAEPITKTDLEVVFWNGSRDNSFEDAFEENGGIPDVLVIVESKRQGLETVQSQYSQYHFYKSIRGISIFSKEPLNIVSEVTSPYQTSVVQFITAGVHFYAVDVTGSPDVPREWELKFINANIENESNTILVGDFNVPYESGLFKNIKKHFHHAFSEKGNGFRETWFWNIPLLSLDHIWVSKDLKILKTEKLGTFKSDHSMLKTYIRRASHLN